MYYIDYLPEHNAQFSMARVIEVCKTLAKDKNAFIHLSLNRKCFQIRYVFFIFLDWG